MHLQRLHDLRYVERRREGLYTFYSLADEDVFALCDIVCGRLEREVEKVSRVVIGGVGLSPVPGSARAPARSASGCV